MRVILSNRRRDPHKPRLLRHRDENSVTATPLSSAFIKRDSCKPFIICIYKNCRVASTFSIQILNSPLACPPQPRRRRACPPKLQRRRATHHSFTPSEAEGPLSCPLFPTASALFHFTYAVSSLFATLTKIAGVWGHSSHSGTRVAAAFRGRHLAFVAAGLPRRLFFSLARRHKDRNVLRHYNGEEVWR